MSSNMFMKLDGIAGESTDNAHSGEFEIMSFNFSANQPTSATRSTSGAATVERVYLSEFSVSKYLDIGTPDIIMYCCQGKPIKTITITCFRADAVSEKPVEYLKYELSDSIVSNYSISGGPGDIPVENLSFNYAKITWNYIPQKESGGAAEGNKTAGWDLFKNVKV